MLKTPRVDRSTGLQCSGSACAQLLGLLALAVAAAAADAGCPLHYQRVTMEEMINSNGSVKPYLLGGPQRPSCTNCGKEALWAKFCAYQSSGPVCAPYLQQQLLNTLIGRRHRELLELSPCDLWPYLQGRTTWLWGDSQTLDFFKGVACFLVEFWDLTMYPPTDDPYSLEIMSRIIGPMCVLLPRDTRVCYVRIDHGNQVYGELLPAFERYGLPQDQVVINFGQHSHVTYAGNLTELANYLAVHPPGSPGMPAALFWQEMVQTHEPDGWPAVRWPCKPIQGISLTPDGQLVATQAGLDVYLQGGPIGSVANRILVPTGIPILKGSYNESVMMADFHRFDPDGPGGSWQGQCVHYCHPAAPQTSTFALYKALKEHWSEPTAAGLGAAAEA